MYRYRIIITNPGSISELYVIQSSYNGGDWATITHKATRTDAEEYYNELVEENTRRYGYRVIKSSDNGEGL